MQSVFVWTFDDVIAIIGLAVIMVILFLAYVSSLFDRFKKWWRKN